MLSATSRSSSSTTTLVESDWLMSSMKGKRVTTQAPAVVTVRVVRSPAQKPPVALPTQPVRLPSSPKMMGHRRGGIVPSSSVSSSSLSSLTSVSSSSSEDDAPITKKRKTIDDAPLKASNATAKKRRVDASSRASSNAPKRKKRVSADDEPYGTARAGPRTVVLSTEDVYRKSRSRSVSAFEHENERVPCERKTWCDEDGKVGDELNSCEKVVKRLMHKYKTYFRNPQDLEDKSFEPHPTDYPYVDLEYPNDCASERFMLLEPKDKDHYNPIMCLELTLHTIIRFYLTPEQKALFGTLPEEALRTPGNTAPNSSAGVIFSSPLTPLSSLPPSTQSSPLTVLSEPAGTPPQQRDSPTPSNNLLRSLNRAIHLRDGPSFLIIMAEINRLLRSIKNPESGSNPLRAVPHTWSASGVPQGVIGRIIEECYQRCVGPHIDRLKKYTAFTSEVYGELMPAFTTDILAQTNLRPDSLFLDLGSGVGNVVLQTALQSGCKAFGIELMDGPASIAELQRTQLRLRCRMWGIDMGEVELMKGDMTACPRVDELLSKADVVLVNNFVFKEELNAALRPKFLDLKEGAVVVSLKPFAPPSNQRLTERNIDDISAIFDVISRPYHSGTVSWSSGSGQYYIHRVDREGYSDVRAEYERIHGRFAKRKTGRRQGFWA